jgi:hypothetical protein
MLTEVKSNVSVNDVRSCVPLAVLVVMLLLCWSQCFVSVVSEMNSGKSRELIWS